MVWRITFFNKAVQLTTTVIRLAASQPKEAWQFEMLPKHWLGPNKSLPAAQDLSVHAHSHYFQAESPTIHELLALRAAAISSALYR